MWDSNDRSVVRAVKIEKGSEDFNAVAIAMGWDSGDHLFQDLIEYGLEDEVNAGGYLAGDEVGSRETAKGLTIDEEINVFVCYGNPTRWDILNVISVTDESGELWVRSKDVCEF